MITGELMGREQLLLALYGVVAVCVLILVVVEVMSIVSQGKKK